MATTPAPLGSISDAIDNAVSQVDSQMSAESNDAAIQDTAPVEGEQPVADETATETPAEGQAEGEAGDQPAEQPADQQPELEDEFDVAPDKKSPDEKTYFYRAAKAQRLMAAHDFKQRIDEVIPGATVDDVKSHYERSVAAQQMLDDFQGGDPDAFNRWMDFHVGQNANPTSVALLAEGVLSRLPQSYPQIYQRMETQVLQSRIEGMYRKAVESGNEELLHLAQHLDMNVNGRYRKQEEVAQRSNPLDEQRQQFEQERKQFFAERQREAQARANQFVQETDRMAEQAINEEIEAALAPVAGAFKDKPQWRFMTRELQDKVTEARKANPTWDRQYQSLRQRVLQQPSDEARRQAVDQLRTFARRAIAQNRKAVIDSVTQGVLQASSSATQKTKAAVAQREPAGGGTPVNRSSSVVAQARAIREKGGSSADILKSTLGW